MRTHSKSGKKTMVDVMTSSACSDSTFSDSAQETLTLKMGRNFFSMENLKTVSSPPSPADMRKTRVIGKHSIVRCQHEEWEQVVEEITWKFAKVS